MTQPETTIEYSVWYNAPDGVRRELRAEDDTGVQQIIADIHADETKRQQLAASVGLHIDPLELGITVLKTTTSTEQIQP